MLEGLTAENHVLDLDKLHAYAKRLAKVIEIQEARPKDDQMNLHEILGRKQAELENLNVEYDRVLQLLAWLASGEVDSSRVTVDLKSRTWSLTEATRLTDPVPENHVSTNRMTLPSGG